MRIAVVGSGISGLLCARLLHEEHEVTLFEAGQRCGGHTNTVGVRVEGRSYEIDTGFIVYNERTYPGFVRLLALLGVESQPTSMSFSVSCERSGLEYGSGSLGALFAQPSNLLRRDFRRLLREVPRFHREARALLDDAPAELTLGSFLEKARYSDAFVNCFLVPMGAAIWSTEPARFLDFPASSFARFFENHGLLSIHDQPRWRVIRGGSSRYVEKLTAPFRDRIRVDAPVRRVRRTGRAVEIHQDDSAPQIFDEVVLATHSDQALRLLADATRSEREVLGAIPYQPNDVVLHTDVSVLPCSRRAWSAWNYRVPREAGPVSVSYDMNLLQGIESEQRFCVTLNDRGRIDPARVLFRTRYEHPLFTSAAMLAQKRHAEISGRNRTHFAGAYWGYGFHEDGVKSALAVARSFGLSLEHLVTPLKKVAAARTAMAPEERRLAS